MSKQILLEDINLSCIKIVNEGKSVVFEFLDMTEGLPLVKIRCDDILHLVYSNFFSKNDGFACYIGEVTAQSYSSNFDVIKLLEQYAYPFYYQDNPCINEKGTILLPEHELILLKIEGGEISISILCRTFMFDKEKQNRE